MDLETLAAYGPGYALDDATIPELPGHHRGKVRDSYDLPGGRRLLIATDRLSAFDRILTSVPLKGQVLTQTARYWFESTADICPNHVIEYPDPNVLLARRLTILPVEIVVRGYLAGTTGTSILTLYQQGRREMYGARFPDGLRPNEQLAEPIITPTTKADAGGHDEPLSAAEILERGLLTPGQWETVSDYAIRLFARGQAMAWSRGLILADTKYELGLDEEGSIVLADEIHTPDSSRYWVASSYDQRFERGERPESFDKDFVRSWVAARCDPYKDPIPEIPDELVLQTAEVYVRAFETITGQDFTPPPADEPVLQRIRGNLQRFF
jgi:phosphoribosylaminoimidazole-succinocarboxamide synthase